MAVVDIMDIVDQRVAQIEEDDPELDIEDTYFVGEMGLWCLLTISDEEIGEIVEFEFVESAESWKRPDAVLEYNEAVNDDTEVLVIVPDESFMEASELLARAANPGISISDYQAMELVPQPLVS